MQQAYMTVNQAAELLGVKPGTVRMYVKRNRLNPWKITATQSLYLRSEVEAIKANPPKRTGRRPRAIPPAPAVEVVVAKPKRSRRSKRAPEPTTGEESPSAPS